MRLGQGLMAAAAGSSNPHHNNHRSSSGNKLHTHTDSGDGYEGNSSSSFNHHQSDGSVPTEFLCAINGHVMKAPLRYVPANLPFFVLLSTYFYHHHHHHHHFTILTLSSHPSFPLI